MASSLEAVEVAHHGKGGAGARTPMLQWPVLGA